MSTSSDVKYIAISGGHSKSTAVAADAHFRVLAVAEIVGRSVNHHMYHQSEVEEAIIALHDKLLEKMNIHRTVNLFNIVHRIACSIAGAATESDRLLTEICFAGAGWELFRKNLTVVDDTWAGLLAGTLASNGICGFSGTGSSVYVGTGSRFDGRPFKTDGWGAILGDRGSGFQLAVDTFQYLTTHYDQYAVIAPLFEIISKVERRIRDIDSLQRWFDSLAIGKDQSWRVTFASVASAITRDADISGELSESGQLVTAVAERMADTIEWAHKNNKCSSDTPIVFQGGMFEHSSLYTRIVSNRLRSLTTGDIGLARYRPVIGALLLAYTAAMATRLDSYCESIEGSIAGLSEEDQLLLIRRNGDMPRRK